MSDDVAARRPGSGDYRWQSPEARSGGGIAPGSGRRFWFFTLAGIFLALISAAAIWMLLVRPPPAPPFFLSINIGDYNARQYPVVAFARQDGERILRYFPAKKQPETKAKDLLTKELKGLASKSEPLIVHITALALVRGDKVYLLPGDADPTDVSSWMEIRTVVDAVSRCPAQNKLLILDLSHPLADARFGVLADRVAETLEDYLTEEKPSFHVLCPCSAGQHSLTSEGLQSSVFGYYLDQALQGHADADKDRRITVQELFAFVSARVDRWAVSNRAARQKPRLFGTGANFVVMSPGRDSPDELERAEPEPYPARMQDGWKSRDLWRDKDAFRGAPRFLQKLEAGLLRQEAQTLGGAIQKNDLAFLDDELQSLNKDIERVMTLRPTPARSLALVPDFAKGSQPLIDTVLEALALAKNSGGKKEELAKIEEELVKKLKLPKDIEYPPQAWAVMEGLNRVPQMTPDHVRLAQNILNMLKPKQRLIELVYLQRLTDFSIRLQDKDPDTWKWQPEPMQQVLQTMRSHQAVIGALDREPALVPWLAPLVDEADKLRRAGEEKVLWKHPTVWKQGLNELQSAKERYDQTLQTLEMLRGCRVDLDRAFADLPAYMLLLTNGTPDVQADETWMKVVDAAEKLQAFFLDVPDLKATAQPSLPTVKLDAQGRELHRLLQDLDKVYRRRLSRAEQEETAEALQQMTWLLNSSLLKAPERVALLGKQRELAGRLQTALDKLDHEDNRTGRLASLADEARSSQPYDVGLTRARMSLGLLRLGGFDLKEKPVPPVSVGKENIKEFTALEMALYDAWSRNLPQQWNNAKSPIEADLLNRIAPPWSTENRSGGVEKDASQRLQKKQRDVFLQWLSERYQAESVALDAHAANAPASAFYLDAARELR